MYSLARGAACRTIAPAHSGGASATSARTARSGRSSSRATTTGNTGARNMSEQNMAWEITVDSVGYTEIHHGLDQRCTWLGSHDLYDCERPIGETLNWIKEHPP